MDEIESPPQRPRARVPIPQMVDGHRTAVVAAAALAPLVLCAALSTFRDSVTAATAVLLLVLLVIAAASTGLRLAGLVAALSAGVWFDFFLTQPYGRLAIDDRDNVEATLLLVLIGASVTEVALWGHRHQARAQRRAGYLDGVLTTAEVVTLRTEAPEALVAHVADQIREVLGVNRCRFVAGPVLDPRIPVLDHQGAVSRRGHDVDVDRDGLPTDDDIALVLTRGGVPVGHYLLTSAAHIARPSLEQRKVAVLLADQASQVLPDPAQSPG